RSVPLLYTLTPRSPPSTLFPYTTLFRSFCRPFGTEKIQSCAERDVISQLGKSRFLAPAANDPVCAGIFANWNALMWQVRNLKKRSEEHTSELQSRVDLVCRLLLEKKK